MKKIHKIGDSGWLMSRIKRGVKATQVFFLGIGSVIVYFVLQVIGLSSAASIIVIALVIGLILMAKE